MIRQIKQQLNQQTTKNSPQVDGELNHSIVEEQFVSSPPSLTDADCEFLFNQLLEGVAHGWHQIKIAKFFQRLEERGQPQLWVAWLERYGAKVLASSGAYQQQLGARMMRLGELTQSHPSLRQIGIAAYNLGRQLLYGKNPNLIWEYNGADLPSTSTETTAEAASDRQNAGANVSNNVPTVAQKNSSSSPSSSSFADAASWIQEAIAEFVELAENTANESTTAKSETENKSESQPSSETVESSTPPQQQSEESSTSSPETITPPQPQSKESSRNHTTATEQEKSLVEKEPNLVKATNIKPSLSEDESVINLSWQQFVELVQQDDSLVEQIAQHFELTDKDPKSIIQAVASQLNPAESESTDKSSLKLVESWFNLGLKQASTGDLEEAIISWEKALELNPNLTEAWHNRGSALGRAGNYEQAVASFEQALKIDPDNAQAWNDLAHAFYQLDRWHEAVASWDKALVLVPSNYQFWYTRGCALEELKQYQEAIASYEKSLEIRPDFQLARSRYISLIANRYPKN